MIQLPTGTVTFLFTDLEASTRRWQADPESMRTALARHDETLRSEIAAASGHLVKSTGDGVLAVFSRADQAATAATAAQHRFTDGDDPDLTDLRVRMALDTGEADEREGDYFGPVLNRAARLLETAHGGQILMSAATEAILSGGPTDLSMIDLGRHRLRDLTRPQHVYQLVHPDLPREFPPLRSLDARPNNLPIQPTSFVGRTEELKTVVDLLTDTRMLTLIGVGGTGKTRLALQTAAELLDRYRDGVWFVELAPLADGRLVAEQAAAPFGVHAIETGSDTQVVEVLADHLRGHEVLIVLDNCEHLVEASCSLADTLVRGCPEVRILATSRELLGCPGEVVYRVPPLQVVPEDTAVPERSDAVRLFSDRAAQVRPDFRITDDNREDVREIVDRLEGLPLAIELAASRIKVLTPFQIRERLQDRFVLLDGRRRTAGASHETLRATMDWSYDLLDEAEREMLCGLSVFSGGWTLEAAEAVCPGGDVAPEDVLDLLAGLADKSLVEVDETEGINRYRLLETVRQYALDRFPGDAVEQEVRTRHAAFFLSLAEEGESGLRCAEQAAWMSRLEIEHDNIRGAIRSALDAGHVDQALRLVAAMGWFWWMAGYWREGLHWFRRVYDDYPDADPALRGRVVYKVASIEVMRARPADVKPLFEEALKSFRRLGDPEGIAYTNLFLLNSTYNPESEDHYLEECTSVLSDLGDDWGLAWATFGEGGIVDARGDSESGLRLAREGIARFVELGDRWMASWMAFLLGSLLAMKGELGQAREVLAESADLATGTGDRWAIPHAKCRRGIVETMAGDSGAARRLFAEALPILRRIGDENCTSLSLCYLGEVHTNDGELEAARDRLGESLRGYQSLRNPYGIGNCLRRLAWLAVSEGLPDRATRLLGAADAISQQVGGVSTAHDRDRLASSRESLEESLGKATFEAEFASGAAMSEDEAVRYALRS